MKIPKTIKVKSKPKTKALNKALVIKSVCPLCESKRCNEYGRNVNECLDCGTHYGRTVL
jgi:ribosomal protein L37AE/L43A